MGDETKIYTLASHNFETSKYSAHLLVRKYTMINNTKHEFLFNSIKHLVEFLTFNGFFEYKEFDQNVYKERGQLFRC